MLRIRRAAAVSEEQDFSTVLERIRQEIRHGKDPFGVVLKESVDRITALAGVLRIF